MDKTNFTFAIRFRMIINFIWLHHLFCNIERCNSAKITIDNSQLNGKHLVVSAIGSVSIFHSYYRPTMFQDQLSGFLLIPDYSGK